MKVLNIEGIEIFTSVYEYLDSNMYLFFPSDNEAIILDPHIDGDFLTLLQNKGVTKIFILLTHEHTDHTSGIYWYQERFDCKIVCQKNCAEYISEKRKRLPLLISFILEERDRTYGTHFYDKFKEEYIPRAYQSDIIYAEDMHLTIGNMSLDFISIPGHSKGSSLIIVNKRFAFTGDSLMKDNPIITRFPGSDHQQYVDNTLPKLSALDPELTILPGHGNSFPLKEMMVDGKLHIEYK